MADPFVAEIRMFPFNFAPKGWAWCDGQLLPLSQNTALFSLLGTTYGGNGTSNFALPNLQGRVPINFGQGPGQPSYALGASSGWSTVTLLMSQMPMHSHALEASTATGTTGTPTGQLYAGGVGITQYAAPGQLTPLDWNGVANSGGGGPHNNMQPFLTLYFAIALQGIFPPRS